MSDDAAEAVASIACWGRVIHDAGHPEVARIYWAAAEIIHDTFKAAPDGN